MKIVHLIMMFQTGGAETMLVDVTNKQVKDGHQVSLVIMNNDVIDTALLQRMDYSITVRYINRPRGSRNPWFVLKLNYELLSLHPDVVHCHNLAFANLVYTISCRKIFITEHNCGHNYLVYSRLSKVNKIFAISNMVKEDVEARYGAKYKNMVVVENGICLNTIERKTNYQKRTPFKIIMVSRLNLKQKAQDVLLKSIALINEKHPGKLTLDLIGTGDDEPIIKILIHELNLGDTVRLLGNQTREYVYSHLCKYDLLIQSSRFEGFGLTVVEGMSAGLPVLVSDNGGPMEIIDSGKYGFHFKIGDVADCANKIEEIMEMTEEEREKAGNKSVERSRMYSLDSMVEKYYHYYTQ